MLKNVTIKARLIIVVGLLSLQLIIGGVIGIFSLGVANDRMRSQYENRLVAMGYLDQIVRTLEANQLIIAKALSGDMWKATESLAQVSANTQAIDKLWETYAATEMTPEEKALAAKFVESRKNFVVDGLLPAVALIQAMDRTAATDFLHGPMVQRFEAVQADIDKLIALQLDVAKKEFEESQQIYTWVRNVCSAGILAGLLIAHIVGTWLVRAITRPLNAAVKAAGAVAAGDLTHEIRVVSTDETGKLMQALKNMNESLVRIVSEVRTGTEMIGSASSQIASGNLDLSARTEQQASSLEETASSMEELTSTVKQNADNARQANTLATSASEVASKGGAVVKQVVDTMGSINDSSKKIVDIIGVIDGIAFQTNILALNAAVEAARAGEQGRGFAVVASEVRSLAQRSANAAKEIKALIGDSVEKVEAGAKLVDEAGSTMQEIVESIKRVTDIMGEITAASEEQTAGIEQINQAISQMDEVTQQNAALVEEAAAASQSMQEQSAKLAQAVGVFKVAGGHHVAAPAPRARSVAAPQPVAAPKPQAPQPPQAKAGIPVPPPSPKRQAIPHTAGEDWEEF